MNGARIRVLVVDDSAFARKVLRETLAAQPAIEVVGIARDGLEALEKIAELHPDVVTLDLVMPNLDGLGVLRALPAEGGPRILVVSISDLNSAIAIEALQIGAFDLIQKPTALATNRMYELADDLVAKVLAAGAARSRRAEAPPPQRPARRASGAVRLVVIGTSTGGPQALSRILPTLPRDLPCAVAVALHIPAGYTRSLAERLDEACAVHVYEATDGGTLAPGSVAIAPGGMDMRLGGSDALTTHILPAPATHALSPSVDALFESASVLGPAVLGVVLTGMGNDGVKGARAIRDAGGGVITEAEASCVVYGMPRAVSEAGLSDGAVVLDDLVAEILARL